MYESKDKYHDALLLREDRGDISEKYQPLVQINLYDFTLTLLRFYIFFAKVHFFFYMRKQRSKKSKKSKRNHKYYTFSQHSIGCLDVFLYLCIDFINKLRFFMKIALIGYGKMGHMIESIARERGHEIVSIIDQNNLDEFDSNAFASADVAIEFTTPQTAADNILRAWKAGVPVVCGTTGWNIEAKKQEVIERKGDGIGLMWSSNYSIGVNILFALNKQLAKFMEAYPDYTPHMTEVHHIHKLDAPSGTAKTLQESIGDDRLAIKDIESIREGEVAGIHTVTWDSEIDTISISHSAKSRKGFALGAVIAAEWMKGKTGWHDFSEVIS
jgi:4-hydroxy-tetrahydrodipicolinate reductase